MSSITRRTALARGGRAALATGAVAVLATPAMAAAATDPGDARIVDLERRLRELTLEWIEAENAFDAARLALPEWARVGMPTIDEDLPMFADACSLIYILRPALEDMQRLNRKEKLHATIHAKALGNPAIVDDELVRGEARIRYWYQRQREQAECHRRAGLPALQARIDTILARTHEVEDEIVQTPARSAKAVAVKLRLAITAEDLTGRASTDPDLYINERAVISALEALERLGAT